MPSIDHLTELDWITKELVKTRKINLFWDKYSTLPSAVKYMKSDKYEICMTEKYNMCYEYTLSLPSKEMTRITNLIKKQDQGYDINLILSRR